MSRTSSGAFNKCHDPDASAVLEFWFGDIGDPENVKRRGQLWFASSRGQDREIRERFGVLHGRAQRGGLDDWTAEPKPALALIVLLDQFTRNLYRGTGSAFTNDARSLAIARGAIERGFERALHTVERAFLYMPFQHSEDRDDQDRSVRLFRTLVEESPAPFKPFAGRAYEHALLHRELIERFGRFSHRNALLGRRSTQAEQRYLEKGGHRFGQG